MASEVDDVMEERRKFHRVKSNFSLEVHPSESGEGTSENVSTTGLLFNQKSPAAIGTLLYLTAPSGDPSRSARTNVQRHVRIVPSVHDRSTSVSVVGVF